MNSARHKKLRLKTPKPRNPLVVPAAKRKAGAHGKSTAAQRRAEKKRYRKGIGTPKKTVTNAQRHASDDQQARKNRPNLTTWTVYHFTGGVDGTRTRDPRRDRPVF